MTLPDTFYDSLHSDVDATHLEQDEESLVARIHDVLFDFTYDASVATTSLCVKPRVLVSAHVRPWRSIDQLREAVPGGRVFHSLIEILARLLRDQATVLVDIVRKSKKLVGPMEAQLLAKRISVSRGELASLRRCWFDSNGFWRRNRLHFFAFLIGVQIGSQQKNFRIYNNPHAYWGLGRRRH